MCSIVTSYLLSPTPPFTSSLVSPSTANVQIFTVIYDLRYTSVARLVTLIHIQFDGDDCKMRTRIINMRKNIHNKIEKWIGREI